MRSIKIYLLTNLLVGMVFCTTLAILGHIYTGQKQVHPHLDAQLVLTANNLKLYWTENKNNPTTNPKTIYDKNFSFIKDLDDLPYDDKDAMDLIKDSIDAIHFRIYDENDQLIAKSPNAPKIKPYHLPTYGFHRIYNQGGFWRLFVIKTDQNETIITMQPHAQRTNIDKSSNSTAILITLSTIGPLGIFILVMIERSLSSVSNTGHAISKRAENHLEPIETDAPIEIQPLINELNLLFKRLKESFERERAFAQDAAHELKTPLAAIKTHAQVLMNEKEKENIDQSVKKVCKSVDRASHTVDQLLMLSRTMPDVYARKHHEIAINHLLREKIAQLVPMSMKKNINLSFECDDEQQQFIIWGHKVSLEILFNNLIDNAIRYSPAYSNIDIILEKDSNNEITAKIKDQGPGIDISLHEKVFERFYRIEGNKADGTGLGLNIAKQIAILNQASIHVENNTDQKGVSFIVKFSGSEKTD